MIYQLLVMDKKTFYKGLGLNENKKSSYVEPDAGHYGIFAGRYWRNRIRPLVLDVMNKK